MDIDFLKQLRHQILEFDTVSKAKLNCIRNTLLMQYLVISFIGDIYLQYPRT